MSNNLLKLAHSKIYLAPLQGFTDYIYRKNHSLVFSGVDKFFIPYISIKNNTILKKYEKEIFLQNNPKNAIPQVLVKDSKEMILLSELLKNQGYTELNLNLGCPYPMVTNQGRGAGILPNPDILKEILTRFYEKTELRLSVKLRAGLHSADEIQAIIPVLNQFPLTEVILHPRVARQLYSGTIDLDTFAYAKSRLQHPLVYNGDIHSYHDYSKMKERFQDNNDWMLGRGILMNPFLPAEIQGILLTTTEKKEKLFQFHQLVLKDYMEAMDNEGNALNKMKQFWIYFSHSFPHGEKLFKQIKKSKSLTKYQSLVNNFFLN